MDRRPATALRQYQQRIATYLYEHDEALAVVRMGGGKTAAALTAIAELLRDGAIRHALIVAPKRVAEHVWPDELAAWAHLAGLSYKVLTGGPVQRGIDLRGYPARDLTVIGIDNLQWLVDTLKLYGDGVPLFDLLVIDEISKLRDPTGKRAKAIAKAAPRWRMVWGLTGTLRPNSAQDLFMPARVVTRGKLWGSSFYKWQRQHFYPLDRYGYRWEVLPTHEDLLNADIAPWCVTLQDSEMPQLPGLTVIFDKIELPAAARRAYNQMEARLFADLPDGGDRILAASAAVATGKLAQIANGFLYEESGTAAMRLHEAKREWLAELIDSHDGTPLLLVYEFIADLQTMQELLGDKLTCLGDTQLGGLDTNIVDAWNARKIPFLAMHPASGGHGLNLQAGGSTMAWIAPTWSPELWEQTLARLHRSGQRDPVMVRVCTATATVDELKLDRVHRKMSAQAAFERYLASRGATPPAASTKVRAVRSGAGVPVRG